MKKFLCLILLLCLLAPPLCLAETTEPALVASFSLPEGETVSRFCSDEAGGFYVLTNISLYHWNPAAYKEEYVKISNRDELAGICCYQGKLYGVMHDHTAAYYSDAGWNPFGKNTNARSELYACHLTAMDGKLFYTYKEDWGNEDILCLYSFDINSGMIEEWQAFDGIEIYADEAHHCVYHLSPANGGTLYC